MLWVAIVLMLAVLLAIGFARAKPSRRRQPRDGGDSGYSPMIVADDGRPVHIRDADAADWGGDGGGDGGGD